MLSKRLPSLGDAIMPCVQKIIVIIPVYESSILHECDHAYMYVCATKNTCAFHSMVCFFLENWHASRRIPCNVHAVSMVQLNISRYVLYFHSPFGGITAMSTHADETMSQSRGVQSDKLCTPVQQKFKQKHFYKRTTIKKIIPVIFQIYYAICLFMFVTLCWC